MHPTSAFHWSERADLLTHVDERAFGTIVAVVDARPVVAQVPLIVDGDRLLLHLSRGNPLVKLLPVHVVAIVGGPDAYVSPDWYAHEDQVPTWSYVSVEVEGELVATDEAMLRVILERQSAIFEGRIAGKLAWTLSKLTPSVLDAKLKGIAGAMLSINSIRGTRKLSQNKDDADRAGVAAALAASPREADRTIAALMRA